jgi:hypothetical protein
MANGPGRVPLMEGVTTVRKLDIKFKSASLTQESGIDFGTFFNFFRLQTYVSIFYSNKIVRIYT